MFFVCGLKKWYLNFFFIFVFFVFVNVKCILIIIKLLNFIIKCFIFYLDICFLYIFVDNGYFKVDLDDCFNDKLINIIYLKDMCKY